jgi:Tol biopolymer transport system component
MSGKIRFLGLVTLLGLLGAVLLLGVSGWAQKAKPPQPPPPPPADPAIAYVVNISKGAAIRKTKGQLMVMNADGSNQRVVVSETGVNYDSPGWSPDGTQLVFIREDYIGGRTSICIINVNGTGFRKVIEESRDGEMIEGAVTWSPMPLADGLYKIAFADSVRRPDGTYEIDHDAFLVNLDGTGLVQLTNTLGVGEGQVSWSPTADRVTFPATDPETGAGGFVVCRIDYIEGTFSLTTLTACFEFGFGTWANLHEKVAVGKGDAGGVNDIWIYNLLDPSLSYQLTSTPNNYEHDQSWSPDDSKILFVQGASGQLSVINSDGSGLTPICPGVDFNWRSPRWRRNLYPF